MSKIFLSRSNGNIPWGFRLQGGSEYNEPLTLTNIMPNSPADGKIDPGDILIEIAGNNAIHIAHKEALELIQRCGNALFLTVYKVDHSYPSSGNQMWNFTNQQYSQTTIPQAPIFDMNLIANALRSSRPQETTEFSNLPAVLAKSLGRPGGPKPFTYTPGGIDLSKIRETARIKRSNSTNTQNMNRRMIVPPDQMSQHHYAGINPIQPFSYARQQVVPPPPRKSIQHDTDVITQSRAFQLLEGWISDNEKNVSVLQSSNRSLVEDKPIDRRSSAGGPTSLPSRSFRYLQDQYNDDDNNNHHHQIPPTTYEEKFTSKDGTGLRRGSDGHTPSRSFKYLQDQYNTSQHVPVNLSGKVDNRNDLMEIYNKTPPSVREREPEARRYTGSTIPSRSFRYLQMMTEDNSPPSSSYTKPTQQSLLNKYDEQNLSTNTNRMNDHPSRSFKYLQTMTGEQKPSEKRIGSFDINSTDIGSSDF